MDREELRRRVDEIDWWHSIDLGQGIVTPGKSDTASLLARIDLAPNLTGLSVLDVGAWDGYYSFEAERRGAADVAALDLYSWQEDGSGSWGTKAGFELAREARNSKVRDVTADVMEITPEVVGGEFDVVLFLGVLYHLRDPLAGLERIASVTRGQLILETFIDLTQIGRPAAAFYPAKSMVESTNWWGPNTPAVIAMLETVGFKDIRVVWPASRAQRVRNIAYNIGNVTHSRLSRAREALPLSFVATDRLVVHAFK